MRMRWDRMLDRVAWMWERLGPWALLGVIWLVVAWLCAGALPAHATFAAACTPTNAGGYATSGTASPWKWCGVYGSVPSYPAWNRSGGAGGTCSYVTGLGYPCGGQTGNCSAYNITPGSTATTTCVCPANAVLTGSTCTCAAGYVEDGAGGCKVDNPCEVTKDVDMGAGNARTKSLCLGGCGYQLTSGWTTKCSFDGGAYEHCWHGDHWKGTGEQCTVSAATEPTTRPQPTCPVDQCPGSVNGQSVCLPCQQDKVDATGTPKTETTSGVTSDGQKYSTEVTTNADGSSTATTTVCNGETCATTTTTTAADGTQTTTGAGTATSQASFCTDNPDSPICLKSGVTGGVDCGTQPSCSGDAVQCAILLQTWQSKCQTAAANAADTGVDGLVTAGTGVMSGGTAAVGVEVTTVDVSTQLSAEAWLGGAGGLSDKAYTLWGGQSLTIPWSNLNSVLSWLGLAMQALAALVSLRVIMG